MHMEQDTDRFTKATRGSANPLDEVEQNLRHTIFGQERAIEAVVRLLNRARYGFSAGNPRRPRATLLFLGPTGVGKTATARRLGQLLRPDDDAFLKIDCSLFSQGHEVSALVGAPPSYVGRDQKPLLNPDIIEQDNSVVLFDEIEKGQHDRLSHRAERCRGHRSTDLPDRLRGAPARLPAGVDQSAR